MEFSRQEYWNGLPFPSPGGLPNPGVEPGILHCRQILYCLSHEVGKHIHIGVAANNWRGEDICDRAWASLSMGQTKCLLLYLMRLLCLCSDGQGKAERELDKNSSRTVWDSVQFSSVAQSCPTLCDPTDYSLLGSSVHGILQAGILEWVAISFSRGS